MIKTTPLPQQSPEEKKPREGELYRVIELEGERFSLYYGYYEDKDRENPLCDPMPIYPDFISAPKYSGEGRPFVTEMQDACEYYKGRNPDEGCFGCEFYKRGEDFLGLCFCDKNIKKE